MKKIMQGRMPLMRSHGFTLVELMVATTLGILISLGLTMLFQATAKTNRVQDAMAQLQESGRYAISRINNDLRMASFQSLNVSGFVNATPNATSTPNGVNNPAISAMSYVATIKLPDFDPAGLSAPTIAAGWSKDWPANTPWPVSQRYSMQGYECSSGTCSPSLWTGTNALPAAGTAAGQLLAKADVFTVRYLNSLGWSRGKNELSFTCAGGAGGTLSTITVTPVTGSPAFSFAAAGDLALLVYGSRSEIFQVTAAGAALTPTAIVGGTLPCPVDPNATSITDVTLYNFSQDFHTITYYLRLDADPNDATRVIPALVRRDSTISNQGAAANDQELVQGIEQMDFLEGVQRNDGTISYLTAGTSSGQVGGESSATNCSPMAGLQIVAGLPAGSVEPQCLWRSLNSIEVHLLVNSVNNIYSLTPADMAYQYTYSYGGTDNQQSPAPPPAATTTMPSGLKAGMMLRREFVSLVSVRNFNP
ncbi:MAG: PilW family protein [Proteobacteria bacterium]|nr:PilW family protein [Pseudomonadota bacterium]